MKIWVGIALALLFSQVFILQSSAQSPGRGHGFRGGQVGGPPGAGGQGRHMQDAQAAGAGDRHAADHDVIHFLLENHKQIRRTVKELPTGVETLTESNDPEIATKIKTHVRSMAERIEKTLPIRMRDPLFAELFRHTDRIKMAHTETEKGIRVTETSDDPYVVKLIQAHAKVVSGFAERGYAEAMRNHPVPADAK